jgi:hypothetical protein
MGDEEAVLDAIATLGGIGGPDVIDPLTGR